MPGADSATISRARSYIASPIRAREPLAPDFSFTSEDGQLISNAALRGKVILIDFWATWCPPCRESVPMMRELRQKYADKDVRIVGVSGDHDPEVCQKFVAANRMNWTEFIDLSEKIYEAFGINGIPTFIVVDRDGVIRFRQSGLGDETRGDIESAINKALKRPPNPSSQQHEHGGRTVPARAAQVASLSFKSEGESAERGVR